MKRIVCLAVLLALTVVPPIYGTPFVDASAERFLLERVNRERSERGLEPLKLNMDLSAVAREYSFEMAATNRIEHTSRMGLDPADRVCKSKIYAARVAENLARHISPALAHRSLMESRKHRRNILDPGFSEIGIGIVKKGGYIYVTQIFIVPIEVLEKDPAVEIIFDMLNGRRAKGGKGFLEYDRKLCDTLLEHPPYLDKRNQIHNPVNLENCINSSSYCVASYTTGSVREMPLEISDCVMGEYRRIGIGVWIDTIGKECIWRYRVVVVLSS